MRMGTKEFIIFYVAGLLFVRVKSRIYHWNKTFPLALLINSVSELQKNLQKLNSHVPHPLPRFLRWMPQRSASQLVQDKFIHCSWRSLIWGQSPRAHVSGLMLNSLLNNVNNSIPLNNLCRGYSGVRRFCFLLGVRWSVILATWPEAVQKPSGPVSLGARR